MATAMAGCSGPSLGDVEGLVTLDGKPIGNVLVTFTPDPQQKSVGPISSAVTDNQGRYVLRCQNGQPGAVVGWHRVSVEDLRVYNLSREGDGSSVAAITQLQRVPAVYSHANNTPMQMEVHSGTQSVAVELKSNETSPLNH